MLFFTDGAFYSTELYIPFNKSRAPRLLGALQLLQTSQNANPSLLLFNLFFNDI